MIICKVHTPNNKNYISSFLSHMLSFSSDITHMLDFLLISNCTVFLALQLPICMCLGLFQLCYFCACAAPARDLRASFFTHLLVLLSWLYSGSSACFSLNCTYAKEAFQMQMCCIHSFVTRLFFEEINSKNNVGKKLLDILGIKKTNSNTTGLKKVKSNQKITKKKFSYHGIGWILGTASSFWQNFCCK